MKPLPPSISVIVPVYNGEEFLQEAVESVLRQGFPSLEIIIVDDGSTDRTYEVASSQSGNVRVLRQANAGPPAARNRGLKEARGGLIALLDADDLWTPDRLRIQMNCLRDNPRADMVIGRIQLVRASGSGQDGSLLQNIDNPFPALSLGTALIRREAFKKVGYLDESLRFDDDVDWILRAKELGLTLLFHAEVALLYRRHARNITNDSEANNKHFVLSLKRSLERRRRASNGNVLPLTHWFVEEGE